MNLIDRNPLLYSSFQQSISRGTADILEQSDTGLFLRDTVCDTFMLATDDAEEGIAWLTKHEDLHYQLLFTTNKDVIDWASKQYEMELDMTCYQAAYLKKEPPIYDKRLNITVATEDDFPMIREHYHLISDEEIHIVIDRKDLFIGYEEDHPIGFIGIHVEGSMGLLEIFPDYRRKGYGYELECFLIENMMERGMIPCCQIDVNNDKSIALQKKIGLDISKEEVYWLYTV